MRSFVVLALSAVASAIKTNSQSQVTAMDYVLPNRETMYDKAYEIAL